MSRFERQLVLGEVGIAGQARLAHARVLLVGLGGLGCPAASYLAAAGVGTLGLVDPDRVELNNLHRQLLYREDQIGQLKVDVAAKELKRLAPSIQIETYPQAATHNNASALLEEFDLVLDGTDRFEARYAINEAACRQEKANVFAAVYQFHGQLSVFGLSGSACYRCVFPDVPSQGTAPTCAEAGILGAVPGVMGTWQALEALKLILGIGQPLINRMLLWDGRTGESKTISLKKQPNCLDCGFKTARRLNPWSPPRINKMVPEVTPEQLAIELKSQNPPVLLDVREASELEVSRIEGAIHIPLALVASQSMNLDKDADLVVFCRSGGRSASATALLQAQGFSKVRNLTSGINGWAATVDPSIPIY